jgi:hypothetical protein
MSKKELTEQEKENEKDKIFIASMFYTEEIRQLTTDEKEINKRKESIKEAITGLNDSELIASKETLLNHDYFMGLVARCIKGYDDPYTLNEQRLNDLITDFDKINTCFNVDGLDKTLEIWNIYGDIIPRDSDGFYVLNDAIVNKVIDNNGFYISDKEDKDNLKNEIFNTWENQQEILTQDSLNSYSEARNGINFKHFIFCEEYLKRGKIKPTCEHLGISRNTAYLWLKDDKVQAYLKSRQDEIKQETDNMFSNTYMACFNELDDIIKGSYTDNNDKLRAIDVFLKHYANIERIKHNVSTDS